MATNPPFKDLADIWRQTCFKPRTGDKSDLDLSGRAYRFARKPNIAARIAYLQSQMVSDKEFIQRLEPKLIFKKAAEVMEDVLKKDTVTASDRNRAEVISKLGAFLLRAGVINKQVAPDDRPVIEFVNKTNSDD